MAKINFTDAGSHIEMHITEQYENNKIQLRFVPKTDCSPYATEGYLHLRTNGINYRFLAADTNLTGDENAQARLLRSWINADTQGASSVVSMDAAGRNQTALPVVLGDYKFINSLLPENFSTEVNGTGAIAHDTATNSADLSTSADGDWAVIQSYQWHPYFNGKAQQPEFTQINFQPETNIEKRIGYYSSSTSTPFNTSYDGVWLRSEGGTVYLEIFRAGTEVLSVAQSSWDDPLDGSGESGITIDWSKFNVTYFDFLYLGGTSLSFYMILDGKITPVHTYVHANNVANTIMSTPSQPIRAEIRQTGAGSGSLNFVCAQVTSSGDSNQLSGFPVAIQSGLTRVALTNGGRVGLLKIRLKDGFRDLSVFQEVIETVTNGAAGNTYLWELRLNPTLDSGAWGAYADASVEGVEVAVGVATTIMNGDGYYISGGNGATRGTGGGKISKLRRLGTAIDGTQDEFVLIMIAQDNSLAGHVVLNTNIL